MADIVDRLRFDATRCAMQFSKGVATNIEEAADEIAQLRAALRPFAKAAAELDGNECDGSEIWEHPVAMNVTFGNLRVAATLLKD